MSFPEEHEIYASRLSAFGLTLFGIFAACVSFYSRTGDHPILSWVLTIVFAAGVPILAATIFRPSGLLLSPEGMTFKTLRGNRLYRWENISQVRVQKMPGRGLFRSKRVWFYVDAVNMGPVEKILAKLTRGHGMISSNFGYSAEQLTEMILAFQQRALARRPDTK